MVSTAGKMNSNNVRDNQNGRKSMILIGEKKKQNFCWKTFTFPLHCSVSCCSYFAENIPKCLRSSFLIGAELFQFVLRIASQQYGSKPYPEQKSFRNGRYPHSVNMVLVFHWKKLSYCTVVSSQITEKGLSKSSKQTLTVYCS